MTDQNASNHYIGDRGEDELYIEPVIGFRTWRLNRGVKPARDGKLYTPRLRGVTHQDHWDFDGPSEAICKKAPRTDVPPHDAPAWDCQCGFYGYYNYITMLEKPVAYGRSTKIAQGLIAGWGRSTIHELGFRTQYARPIALLLTDFDWFTERDEQPEGSHGPFPMVFEREHLKYQEHLELIRVVAEAYRIPIIEPSEAQAFASEHGTPIL